MAKKTVVNTMRSMGQVAPLTESKLQEWEAKVDQLCEKWDCKKGTFSIPKSLQGIHGSVIPLGLNFEYLYFPVDGQSYSLPEPMVSILRRSIGLAQAQDVKDELIKQGLLKEVDGL